MAKLPHQTSGTVITAADHWNPLVDAINTEGDQLNDTNQRLAATNTDVGALQTRATNAENRLGTAETKIAANTKSISDNASSSKQTTDALASRLSTVESRTNDSKTGNTALGTRMSALEAGGTGGGGGGSGFAPQAVTLTQSAVQTLPRNTNAAVQNWQVSGTQSGTMFAPGNRFLNIPANGFYLFSGTLVLQYNEDGQTVLYFTTESVTGNNTFAPAEDGHNVLGAFYVSPVSGGGVGSLSVPIPLTAGAVLTAGQKVCMVCWSAKADRTTMKNYGGQTVFSAVRLN